MEIKRIVCCCASGLGSSMIVSMNVQRALRRLEISGVTCDHVAFSKIDESYADLFVVGRDLEEVVSQYNKPVIILDQLMDANEIEGKIKELLGL